MYHMSEGSEFDTCHAHTPLQRNCKTSSARILLESIFLVPHSNVEQHKNSSSSSSSSSFVFCFVLFVCLCFLVFGFVLFLGGGRGVHTTTDWNHLSDDQMKAPPHTLEDFKQRIDTQSTI